MDTTTNFKISQEGLKTKIEVDGQDISHKLRGVRLVLEPRKIPELWLEQTPNSSEIELEGVVYVVGPPDPQDTLRLVKQFLQNLDPQMVEQEALESLQWGEDKSVAMAVIQKIIEVVDASVELTTNSEVHRSTDDRPVQD